MSWKLSVLAFLASAAILLSHSGASAQNANELLPRPISGALSENQAAAPPVQSISSAKGKTTSPTNQDCAKKSEGLDAKVQTYVIKWLGVTWQREGSAEVEGLDEFDYRGKVAPDDPNQVQLRVRGQLGRVSKEYVVALPEAIRWFDSQISGDPRNADLYARRGWAWALLGELQTALDDLEKATTLAPTKAVYLLYRGNVLQQMGEYRRAMNNYDAAYALDRRNAAIWRAYGVCEYQMDRFQTALVDFNEAIRYDSTDARSYSLRGLVRAALAEQNEQIGDATRLADTEKAMQALSALCATNASAPDFRIVSQASDAGASYLNAAQDFCRAVRLDGHLPSARAGVGAIWHRLGIIREGMLQSDRSVASHDEDFRQAVVWEDAAIVLFNNGWDSVFVPYSDSNEPNQERIKSYCWRGMANYERTKYTCALCDFKAVIAIDPANADANLYLAKNYLRLFDYSSAKRHALIAAGSTQFGDLNIQQVLESANGWLWYSKLFRFGRTTLLAIVVQGARNLLEKPLSHSLFARYAPEWTRSALPRLADYGFALQKEFATAEIEWENSSSAASQMFIRSVEIQHKAGNPLRTNFEIPAAKSPNQR